MNLIQSISHVVCGALVLVSSSASWPASTDAASGIVNCSAAHLKKHNPELATTVDQLVCFEAYVSNFNTGSKGAGKGAAQAPAVPHWVAQHVARATTAPEARERPRAWFTIPELQKKGLAPTDDSYKFSKHFRERHSNWYERGHLAQKYLAERAGEKAGWFTHNLANAVPQRGQFNKGPWLTLECFSGAWANQYGEVWVITGPVFVSGQPREWLRSDSRIDALAVAIPDSLFKIVAKKDAQGAWQALAFIYPQDHATFKKGPWDPVLWLTSISQIEKLTGNDFIADASSTIDKSAIPTTIWSVKKQSFDPGCKRFAKEVP